MVYLLIKVQWTESTFVKLIIYLIIKDCIKSFQYRHELLYIYYI